MGVACARARDGVVAVSPCAQWQRQCVMSAPKKSRNFQPEWQEKFGFIERGDRVICSLCSESVVARTSSVKRHYQTKHEPSFSALSPCDLQEFLRQKVSKFEAQKGAFSKFVHHGGHCASASYVSALAIAKAGKPFTDGVFLKDAFSECAKELFKDFQNKDKIIQRIQDLPLSARTVQRRIEDMADNVTSQVQTDMQACEVLSLALDESTDNNDVARLAIVARYQVGKQIKEELCALFPMKGTTKGVDVLNAVMQFSEDNKLDLKQKLFSVTTDGAPSMTGKHIGFVKLLEEKLQRPLLAFHCVIHQENLCAKISDSELKNVMATVVKIVNTIVARSALTHRRFQSLLEEMENQYGDLLLHCAVRWLSAGKVLNRFVECLDVIVVFLDEINADYPELKDPAWLAKLMFLTDITAHLNDLNLRLQGKKLTVLCAFEEWKGFCKKLVIFSTDVETQTYKYFQNIQKLQETTDESICEERLADYVKKLNDEFHSRFKDLQAHGKMFEFIVKPDTACDNQLEARYFEGLEIENLQMELIDFQASSIWVDKFAALRSDLEIHGRRNVDKISDCWASLPPKFGTLKKVACALLSAFGSSYTCEQVFSHMKYVLGPIRSRLTPNNSEKCVKLKFTEYQPDISTLSRSMQDQGSH